jgi:hypothetical protein
MQDCQPPECPPRGGIAPAPARAPSIDSGSMVWFRPDTASCLPAAKADSPSGEPHPGPRTLPWRHREQGVVGPKSFDGGPRRCGDRCPRPSWKHSAPPAARCRFARWPTGSRSLAPFPAVRMPAHVSQLAVQMPRTRELALEPLCLSHAFADRASRIGRTR